MENLPTDILTVIFHRVIFDDAERGDICAYCELPFSFLLASPPAYRLRGVCQRWRRIFWHRFILRGVTQYPEVPWCMTPKECAMQYYSQVVSRMRKQPRVYLFLNDEMGEHFRVIDGAHWEEHSEEQSESYDDTAESI